MEARPRNWRERQRRREREAGQDHPSEDTWSWVEPMVMKETWS